MLASNIISSSNTDAASSVVGSLERQESSSKLGFFLKSVNNSLMKPFQADPIKAISKLNDKQQKILVENVKNIVSVLMKPENLKQEGMLRVSAKKEDLIDCFENVVHKTVSLEKAVNLAENKGIFALSGCLKRIISAIPFILDKDLKEIKAALQIAGNRVPYSKIHKITDEAIKRLPQYQQNILYQAMNYFFMLGEAQEQSSRENKMTHYNIAAIVSQSLYKRSVPTAELTAKQLLEVLEHAKSLPPLVEKIILSWGKHSCDQLTDSAWDCSSWDSIPLDSAAEENPYAEIDLTTGCGFYP